MQTLGIDPAHVVDAPWVDNGPDCVAVLLNSAHAVLDLEPESWLVERVSEANEEAEAATARDIADLRLEIISLRESLVDQLEREQKSPTS